MEDNALISIKTKQEIDGEDEVIELETPGKYAVRNGKTYIIYKESKMTGFDGSTTTIKVSGDCVTVSRKGRYVSSMKYELGEKCLCLVNTPYGQIGAAITTKSIDFDFGNAGGVLTMDYLLDTDNQNFMKNNITITVKAEQKGENDDYNG